MTYEQFINPAPRKNIIEQVLKIAPKYKDGPRVLLCFTCDPYQPLEENLHITQKIIEIFGQNKVNYQILTKSHLVERDLTLIKDTNGVLAMTFTSVDPKGNLFWEPNVPPAHRRAQVLEKAHRMGIPTWISLEPVLFPEQSGIVIQQMHEFVDLWKFGKLNNHAHAKTIDWAAYLRTVWALIKTYDLQFYVKNDLYAFNESDNPQTNCDWK
jgi:DNA repair photolyase